MRSALRRSRQWVFDLYYPCHVARLRAGQEGDAVCRVRGKAANQVMELSRHVLVHKKNVHCRAWSMKTTVKASAIELSKKNDRRQIGSSRTRSRSVRGRSNFNCHLARLQLASAHTSPHRYSIPPVPSWPIPRSRASLCSQIETKPYAQRVDGLRLGPQRVQDGIG